MVALAVGAALATALPPSEPDGAKESEALPSSARSAPPSDPAPSTTSSATTRSVATTVPMAPSTSATAAPTTTTTGIPVVDSGGYRYTPKPSSGLGVIGPGGSLTKHLALDIAQGFGLHLEDVERAIAQVDLPPEARRNPEGWLAPGTYVRGGSVQALVQAMVDRRIAQLEERGIPRDEWFRVITAASVIEKETYNQTEKRKVAQVLHNRLAGGGPLQMDSIILYPVPEDRIFTTAEERASNQPYNSYRHDGLPPTPISSPDEASIDAFLDPVPGDWFFYVTIDLDTGETRYAVTYEEHLANVEMLRAWLRDNPTP